jgi:hypothetical protein
VTAFDHAVECKTEEEFIETLKSVFAAKEIRRIISVLLAQSQ